MKRAPGSNSRYPNICCLQVIDSLGTGGTEKMALLLAQKCAEHGVPFAAVSLSDDGGSEIAEAIRGLGGRVFHFPSDRLLDLKRVSGLRGLIRREKFNLVHAYLTYGNIVGCLAGNGAGVPVIGSLRNLGDSPEYYHPGRMTVETLCLNFLARRVLCNGYAIARAHSKRIKLSPLEVIPNAVEIPDLLTEIEKTALRRELAGEEAHPVIISAGRLVSVKGFPVLIDALALLKDKFADAVLVIAGEGPERDRLEAKIALLGLEGSVRLLGYRKDASRLLQAGDVYVNASTSEGMPVALLEGMAAGLAAVATDVGDAGRVVAEGTGLVVPPGSPEKLAAALEIILADRGRCRKMGQAARARIEAEYNPECWFKRMMKLYENMITGEKLDGR